MEKKTRWIRRRSRTPGCFPGARPALPPEHRHPPPSLASAGMDGRHSGGRGGAGTVRCPRRKPAGEAGSCRSHPREAPSPVVLGALLRGGGCRLRWLPVPPRPACAQGPGAHGGDWRQ